MLATVITGLAQETRVKLVLQKPSTGIFPGYPINLTHSDFKVAPNNYPAGFKPILVKELQVQTSYPPTEAQQAFEKKIRHTKVMFGFVNGEEYYIPDTNNDDIFSNERMYKVQQKDQPLITLNEVQMGLGSANSMRKIVMGIKYGEPIVGIEGRSPIQLFYGCTPVSKGTFKAHDNNYDAYVTNFNTGSLFAKPEYRVVIAKQKAVLNLANRPIIYYAPGDTVTIGNTRLLIEKGTTDEELIMRELGSTAVAGGYETGAMAFNISGKDILNGHEFNTGGANKVLLLDFWGTWCGPCVEGIPALKKLYTANKVKGFEIVSIASDEDINAVRKLLLANEIGWTNLIESRTRGLIVPRFKIQSFPTFLVLDRKGRIALRSSDTRDFKKVETTIQKLL